MTGDGILSGPLDGEDRPVRSRTTAKLMAAEPLDADKAPSRKLAHQELFVRPGMILRHRGSDITGAVMQFAEGGSVVLRDASGRDHRIPVVDGMFEYERVPVILRMPTGPSKPKAAQQTASGSVDSGAMPARVARASRIWVEGIHDAELIERVWGDDLRYEGIVVEQLEGADDLAERVRSFGPRDGRRVGVLLDHLVEGSKESRIAATVTDHNVLILGHPYVDIWEAVKPAAAGITGWPQVPMGQPWKEGVLAALNVSMEPPQFWKHLLGRVGSWTDLETPLVTAVEQLIDFVTQP